MSLKQPPVTRMYFRTESEAVDALNQLENMGIFAELLRADTGEADKWKLVFFEDELVSTTTALKRLSKKPKAVEVFDSSDVVETGWPTFKAL